MSMISESEDRIVAPGGVDSPSADEACNEVHPGGSFPLKKGPWTSAEDAILVEYVTKHGEGNWNAVQKHSGLARCGKSCRLRWANHLRPDLKKGAFTAEEERHIIELHAKMGNKWARMAAELPGRTDNEIKNYWNTRIKRQQRAGLPIYPADISLQALTESKNGNMSAYSDDNTEHPDLLPLNGFDIPAVEFKSLEFNHQMYPPSLLDIPTRNFLDIPTNNLLSQCLDSSHGSETLLSAVYPAKRLRQSDSLYSSLSGNFSCAFTSCGNYQIDGPAHDVQSFGVSSEYDENLTSHLTSSDVLPDSHAHIHGTSSSSEPTWAMKLELPSLQTPIGSWGSPSSPLPSLESVDNLVQSPPTEPTESGSLSPRNSGLLDAVLYESKSWKVLNPFPEKCVAPVVPGLVMDNTSCDLHEAEWEAYHDPITPLGYSTAPMFSNYMPVGESSLVEPPLFETIQGNKVIKQEPEDSLIIPTEYDGKGDKPNPIDMIFSRPDFLLASN